MKRSKKKQANVLLLRECRELLLTFLTEQEAERWWQTPNKGLQGVPPKRFDTQQVLEYIKNNMSNWRD